MQYTIYREEDYKVTPQMGGETKELVMFPKTAEYIERDFIWRLSLDTVNAEEGTFSKMTDYDRVMLLMEGETVLSYENQRVARLAPLEQDRFDGAWKTKSFGSFSGISLMVRKGCEGYMDLLFPKEEADTTPVFTESEKPNAEHALYCSEGYCVVNYEGESIMIRSGQTLVISCSESKRPEYSVMGEGTIIRATVFYDDVYKEMAPEIIPHEKASFDDFKKCVYLANVQFKWAKYFIKSLKTTWFDRELSKAIAKIERYYIPMIIFFVGAMAISIFVAVKFESDLGVVLAILIWLAVNNLIITPLLYMAVVPKPVRKHIKKVSELTPYEQRIREEELGQNERLEKILKKYKNSGKNLGIEDDKE